MGITDRIKEQAALAGRWSQKKFNQAKDEVEKRIDRISEVPGLPLALRQVLRDTRASLLLLIKGVRNRRDVGELREAMVDVVAGAVDSLAQGAQNEPGDFTCLDDVRNYCRDSIKWGAAVVDGVALVAGTFAVSAAAHTAGISFVHFFALCAVMGVLFSLSVGACEIYAVTSLLAHEGELEPGRAALRICASSRKYVPVSRAGDVAVREDSEPTFGGTSSQEARTLAATWVKLSVAGSLPVLNDSHMKDRLDALLVVLEKRAPRA